MVKRLYIPLPDLPARIELITRLLSGVQHSLESSQVSEIALEVAWKSVKTSFFYELQLRTAL
jgi:hypothetical protein